MDTLKISTVHYVSKKKKKKSGPLFLIIFFFSFDFMLSYI